MVLPHDSDPRLAAPRSRSEPTVTAAGAAGGQPAAAEGPPAGGGEAAAAAAAGMGGGGSAATCAPVPEGATAASYAPLAGTGVDAAGAAGSSFAEAARQLAKRESVPAMVEGMLPQVRWIDAFFVRCGGCCEACKHATAGVHLPMRSTDAGGCCDMQASSHSQAVRPDQPAAHCLPCHSPQTCRCPPQSLQPLPGCVANPPAIVMEYVAGKSLG